MNEQDQRIIDYLLGSLPQAEQARLEGEYVVDDAFFEAIVGVENDLIDAYARGELPQADVGPFEKRYLSSPQGRERVAFARTMYEKVLRNAWSRDEVADQLGSEYGRDMQRDRAALASEPSSTSQAHIALLSSTRRGIWSSVLTSLRWPSSGLQLGFVTAMLVLVAFGCWMSIQNRRLRRDLQRVNAAEAALRKEQKKASKQNPAAPVLAAPQVGTREDVGGEVAVAKRIPPPVIASLVLAGGMSRGGLLERRNQLVVQAGVSNVELKLRMERDDYPSYAVFIENPDLDERWEKEDIKTDRAALKQITVHPPLGFLQSGDYVVQLVGKATDGTTHDVESYSFRVVKR
jgi:hypothetical protein